MGARDAPLRVFWVIWAHAMRPYGFFGLFGRTQCAPTGFWGYLGARDAPLQVFGGLGARDAPLRVFGVIWAQAMRPYGFWAHQKAKNPRIKLI
ncbi:hypothetical protein IQ224_17365 [Microcystis sp. LEGE 00066]|uniref:hypothetical protein n=1 Tax=Microcystis sp. LEGE 00066 TaxID=1828685 RepID=UPI00188007CD|nr:hypothetical protein [Microcystis sp. LEGE 00066]MBE9263847.1 hypothetical protein [Microcystis sp. LEGE 00066]